MSVIRVNKSKDYTTMSNYHFKDKRISLKAKGLLSQMLSLPDDWDYSIQGLVAINKESEVAIKGALDELKNYRYLIITKKMPNETESGRIEYVYDIYEKPKQEGEKQGVENLGLEFLGVENQVQYNTNNKITNNKELNINTTTNMIFDILEENGFKITPIQYDVVKEWEDNDLTRYAIKKAVLNNKFNINYIDKILNSYKQDNITTVQQAIESDEEFNNKRNNYYKQKYTIKESRYEREKRILEEMCRDD